MKKTSQAIVILASLFFSILTYGATFKSQPVTDANGNLHQTTEKNRTLFENGKPIKAGSYMQGNRKYIVNDNGMILKTEKMDHPKAATVLKSAPPAAF